MMIVSCVPLSSFFRPKTALIFGFWFSLHLPPYNPFFSPQNGDNSRFIIVILSHGESILKKCTCSVRFVREKQLGCPANIGKRCSVDMIHGSICIGIPMDDIMRQCISKSNIRIKNALDFELRVILSFRSPFSTLRFSLKIKSLT